ncbi:hypothetical protein RRG08_021449 [Elysia crispata]|uniref:Uncharacterized protein n=1 Tax=Elysia crispata TaxID=231223 RepID=A0AAE0XMC7_9GAST|nr:hypothetical protein RRG08_021449 [Elysia crispata]
MTYVDSKNPVLDEDLKQETSVKINQKLKLKVAFSQALTVGHDRKQGPDPATSLKSAPCTFKPFTVLSLKKALVNSSQKAADRYTTRGRPMILKEDSRYAVSK